MALTLANLDAETRSFMTHEILSDISKNQLSAR